MNAHSFMHRLIYFLFFLSGATALVYQVIWVRFTGLVFGNTVYSIATVLGAFMAGLARLNAQLKLWEDATAWMERYIATNPAPIALYWALLGDYRLAAGGRQSPALRRWRRLCATIHTRSGRATGWPTFSSIKRPMPAPSTSCSSSPSMPSIAIPTCI